MPWVGLLWKAISAGWGIGTGLATSSDIGTLFKELSRVWSALGGTVAQQSHYNDQFFYAVQRIVAAWPSDKAKAGGPFGYLDKAGEIIDSALRGLLTGLVKVDGKAKGQSRGIGLSLGRLWARFQTVERNEKIDAKQIIGTLLPAAIEWEIFNRSWTKYYVHPLASLLDWVKHPGDLSKFIAPSLPPYLIATLGKSGQRTNIDRLLRILLADAHDVVGAVDAAAVQVLQSGNYH